MGGPNMFLGYVVSIKPTRRSARLLVSDGAVAIPCSRPTHNLCRRCLPFGKSVRLSWFSLVGSKRGIVLHPLEYASAEDRLATRP